MNHKYSTATLFGIIAIVTITFLVSAISSQDIDDVCNINDNIMKRIDGEWVCSKTAFGELTITNDTTVIISNQSTYYTITGFSLGHGQNIITDENSYFEIVKSGYYDISVSTSFGGGANTEYEMEIFIDETDNPHCELHRKMGTGGDVGSASLSCIDYYNQGEKITVRVADNTNPSQNINIHSMNFNIKEVQ